ncbi:MAG: ArsA family ATPase [Acidimicrobiia bacterium]|nr:ArsA family ATPase [Acidimicrobiia bacterium]
MVAVERRGHGGADPGLAGLLAAREIVITCGSGGVGKTTTAGAAAAMAAAEQGGRVLVLTIDPARRLATALGLEAFGNAEVRIPDDVWAATGVRPRGELWAAMLDTKASWDDLIRLHAPDAATRDSILQNPLYRNITSKFVQSHDYIAMERLHEIHSSGRFDLIVVDTPPTRNAIDFLEAPERMADFFSSRLLRWLIAPSRSRVVSAASKPFYTVADRILGSQFLEDIAEFFILFQSMYDGFVARAEAVTRLLHDQRTAFVVVSTLEAGPAREACFFIEELERRELDLGAVVLNKVLPSALLEADAAAVARVLSEQPDAVAHALEGVDDPVAMARVLREVGESFANFAVVAQREAEQRLPIARRAGVVATVPHLDADVADLAGLLAVGRELWSTRN